jgi:hypothetical protein
MVLLTVDLALPFFAGIFQQVFRGAWTKLGFDESDVGEYEFEVFVEHFKGEEDESDDSEEEQE